ncbi:MAG TPA: tetratricopeptide repeat protein, partial [Kofleriaceae bacterium]|nr:tetratricopeptide repeat protein [Kofleriaceae bacterium]
MPRDRPRPWKRAFVDTQVGVPPAPRRTAGEAARDAETVPNLSIGDDTSRFADPVAEPARPAGGNERTQRMAVPDEHREIGGVTEQVPGLQMRARRAEDADEVDADEVDADEVDDDEVDADEVDDDLDDLGDFDDATQALDAIEAGARIASGQAAGLIEDARRLQGAGDHAGAARALDEASDLLPDDVGLALERDRARTADALQRAAAEARAGDVAGAERRLRGLLAARPHDVEACLALADLLDGAGRTEDAAEHLYLELEAQPDPFARPARARIVHRYARLVAALGAADEAHGLLHEAHRLDRRNLLVTLALGESCFARRLWRESAIHLGSLADHPDAGKHAAAVAAALVRAAQADVRALRPGNVGARLTAAVRIDPGCAPAWHGLAELALERGDPRAAAGHLEREAAATADPRERARLFDAAGDLARDVLGDLVQAERCWMAVADTAGAATLEKLLALLRRRGAGRERGRVCERLAELGPAGEDARGKLDRARKELLEEAAEAYAA